MLTCSALVAAVAVAVVCLLASAPACVQAQNWTYYSASGSYYTLIDAALSRADAIAHCATLNQSQLVSIDSKEEQEWLDYYLQYNYDAHWLGMRYDGNYWILDDGWKSNYTERWSDGSAPVPSGSKTCAIMQKVGVTIAGLVYVTYGVWYPSTCDITLPFVCEVPGPRCSAVWDFANVTYNSWKNYYGVSVTYSCLDGYVMSDMSQANTSQISDLSTFVSRKVTCTLTESGSYDWLGQNVSACVPNYCASAPPAFSGSDGGPSCDICNSTQARFVGGTLAVYTCPQGYRSPYSNASNQQNVTCGNNPNNPVLNMWKPQPVPCLRVRCPPYSALMTSNSYISGRNYKGQIIVTGGSIMYNDWGSTISFLCNDGYIYSDYSLNKTYRCSANGVVGYWLLLNSAQSSITGCSAIACSNWSMSVSAAVANGANVTGDYLLTTYRSSFTLTCQSGHAFPDGTTQKTFTCSKYAQWSDGSYTMSSLPSCITLSNGIVGLVAGKKYQPPAVEAPSAVATGSTVLVAFSIVLTVIFIMDMAVMPREMGILKSNLRRLRQRFCSAGEAEQSTPFKIESL